MNKALSYLKYFKKEIILGPLAKMVEAIFELQIPIVMAQMIDNTIPSKDTQLLLHYSFILLGMTVGGYIFTMYCQYSAARAQEGFGTKLRTAMFNQIQKMQIQQIGEVSVDSLVTRITSDIYQVQLTLAQFIRLAPRAPLIFIGSTIMVFIIDVQIGWIFLVMIPLIALILYLVMTKTIPLYGKIQKQIDIISTKTLENITGIRVIKGFAKEKEQYKNFTNETARLKQKMERTGKIEALLNPLTVFIVNAATIGILYLSGIKINIGTLTQAEVIALINYSVQLSVVLIVLTNLTITTAKGYTSLGRIGEVLDYTPQIYPKELDMAKQNAALKDQAVLFENVSFQYPDAQLPMLGNISFSMKKGRSLGVIGSSGSGKTTMIRLLAVFFEATDGAIYIEGIKVDAYPRDILRKKVNIVFQKAVLFRGTIADNLRMGNQAATDKMLWEALDIAQASSFVREKAEGLHAPVEQGGRNFSGGQRQRLTIARSILADADIMVFDDTSSALDVMTDSKLRQSLATLKKTTITISQRIHSIEKMDQIIVLNNGQVAGIGTHEQLLAENPIYQEIAASQMESEDDKKMEVL